ncbi:MAG: hypothetical protein ABFR36_02475 [Acidobacteriota bacterium]
MKPLMKYSLPLLIIIVLSLFYMHYTGAEPEGPVKNEIKKSVLKKAWKKFSGGRDGKVVYADPPDMVILNLNNGTRKKIAGIVTEGGKGRWQRGKTPRPFWSPDGKFFVFRYSGSIYIADESGIKKQIENDRMNTSKETRWSIIEIEKDYYVFGPSKKRKGIAVNINNPEKVIVLFPHPLIGKHCEVTKDVRFIVYNNGKNIMVADLEKGGKGIRISKKQNCRPCASPSLYAAWLPAPHIKYNIHNVKDGKFIKELRAPENEEIYRLNWSNDEEFAVHMFGSRGNTRMHIRKISSGESLFIGNGWDPDLWIGKDQ